MGVKGLTALLQRLAPDAVKTQHISHYKGKSLAIDVSCFLNRFSKSHLTYETLRSELNSQAHKLTNSLTQSTQ